MMHPNADTSDRAADTTPDVVVLRRSAHGMSTIDYATELRKRLPDRTVVRADTPERERELLDGARVATGHRLSEELLSAATNLELFASATAGVGHLPLDDLREDGVILTNASGIHGPNIAEYVMGAILTFTRNFHVSRRRNDRREWRHHQSRELKGSTVTVVGLGAIGEAIVDRLDPFDAHTIGVRYTPEKGGETDEVIGFDPDRIHGALARTDYLVVSCPLTDETRGLIGAEEFHTLPSDSVLVNVGRGPIVDTEALVDTIRRNGIRGAFLDVTDPEPLPEEHPLWSFGNVFVTPHNAGHTPEYYARLADIVADNVARLETGDVDGIENRVQ